MNKELDSLFQEFLVRLRTARKAESREVAIDAYSFLIREVESFITMDETTFDTEFGALVRMMSEYLPHTDEVLEAWHRIRKLVRQQPNITRQ
jgi:hypothetical protein